MRPLSTTKKPNKKASSYNEIIEIKKRQRQPKELEVEGKRSRHLLLAKRFNGPPWAELSKQQQQANNCLMQASILLAPYHPLALASSILLPLVGC